MNTFGQFFRITIFGESHGEVIGVVVDGCPAGLPLQPTDFLSDLQRRRGGFHGTTARKESDVPHIVSGVYNGHTTGAPITILFKNEDVRPEDYEKFRTVPRPGHADFAASRKWNGFNDIRGSGMFSGRLTVAIVAAGVIAKKLLHPVAIRAEITEAGGTANISEALDAAMTAGDSIGGIIACTATALPAGWGDPFFNSAEALLGHLLFSVPGIKGVEFGAGFKAAAMKGSGHNDALIATDGKTRTNHAGGIIGGLTNGNDLTFRVAVRPASGIAKAQTTMNMLSGSMEELVVGGRHDVCIALRMPVIIEAVTAIVLVDLQQEWKGCSL